MLDAGISTVRDVIPQGRSPGQRRGHLDGHGLVCGASTELYRSSCLNSEKFAHGLMAIVMDGALMVGMVVAP